MSSPEPFPDDPYQAPTARLRGPTADSAQAHDAELIRRAYLSSEAVVKQVGLLSDAGAFLFAAFAFSFAMGALGKGEIFPPGAVPGVDPRALSGIIAGVMLLVGLFSGLLGRGIRGLQPWSRWLIIVSSGLSLFLVVSRFALMGLRGATPTPTDLARPAVSTFFNGDLFFLLTSSRGRMIFSRECREIVRSTPLIRARPNLVVRLIFLLVIGFIVLGGLGVIAAVLRTS